MKEKFCRWLAWRMPRSLVMWCGIRIVAHATSGPYAEAVFPDPSAMDAIKRWEN